MEFLLRLSFMMHIKFTMNDIIILCPVVVFDQYHKLYDDWPKQHNYVQMQSHIIFSCIKEIELKKIQSFQILKSRKTIDKNEKIKNSFFVLLAFFLILF